MAPTKGPDHSTCPLLEEQPTSSPCSYQLLKHCVNKQSQDSMAFSFIGTAMEDQFSEFEFGHIFHGSPTSDAIQEQEHEQDQDSEFEFGCVTPESPTNDPNKNSPADILFFNGRLLPHSFPFQSNKNIRSDYSRATSCTSSISSKDSLMSSRSNSNNSRSSSCSSDRTSSNENSEKKQQNSNNIAAKIPIAGERNRVTRPVPLQPCGSTQRWQFITSAPILKPSAKNSGRKKNAVGKEESRLKKQVEEQITAKSRSGRRFFSSLVSTCRECHALGPSTKKEVLRGNSKLQ